MLIDSHCHLDFPDFAKEGVEAVVARAKAAGVGRMLTICVRIAEFEQVHAIARKFDNIHCTVGTHPHQAEEAPEQAVSLEKLIEYTKLPKVVGIGETGLDYFYDHSPRDVQQKSFAKHIHAALETGLPLIIHARDADDDIIRLLKTEGKGKVRGVMHCFSSGQKLADAALDLGFYISLSGIVTFKKADELRAVVKSVPLNRILVETDSPYLAPIPYRGKTNEPSFVVHTAAAVAELKGVSADELAKVTTENYFSLFTKAI